jgi:hypothetical protein
MSNEEAPDPLDAALADFEEIVVTREEARAMSERLGRGLEVYREHHPSLVGVIGLTGDTITGMLESAGAISSLIPAIRYLITDEDMTVLDHAALSSLIDMVAEQRELLHAITDALDVVDEINHAHKPELLGLKETE